MLASRPLRGLCTIAVGATAFVSFGQSVAIAAATASASGSGTPSSEITAETSPDDAWATQRLLSDAFTNVTAEQILANSVLEAPGSGEALGPLQANLSVVDQNGAQLLERIDDAGIAVSSSIRATLSTLPASADPRLAGAPSLAVYEVARSELEALRSPIEATEQRNQPGNPMVALTVGAIALAALGVIVALLATRQSNRDNELARMAWQDSLTGVSNRRRLDLDLNRQATLGSAPTAVMMVDVDNFKQFNDAHGHALGDMALRALGDELRTVVRGGDVVYRYGGEEFCVLLRDSTVADAHAVAVRILDAVNQIPLPVDDRLSVSIGIADGGAADVVDTLVDADRALFEAKRQGRNQVSTSPASGDD